MLRTQVALEPVLRSDLGEPNEWRVADSVERVLENATGAHYM
jgi:hypothetical protein